MRVVEIIGTVTLSRCHESFQGATLKLARPLMLSDLQGETTPHAEEVVLWDSLGAGIGAQAAMSEGAEAAQPFRPQLKPVDAYNSAILDQLDL